ncbi:MAG TPA: acyl-protein synthetase, partial [Bacillota bacterium]|nr:acyl-protein synthetase [Bacillota bacterium]
MTNPYTREEIDRELFQFIDRGIDHQDEEKFNEVALKEFVFQYHENEVYRKICESQKVRPEAVTSWEDIPALPTQAFKQAIITSFPMAETELSLLTSGTTDPDVRGKIYRDKTSLELINKVNQLLTKEFLFPDVDKMRMMLMVPSPKVAPGMPMAYGLEQAKNAFGTPESAYYISPRGLDVDQLLSDLAETCEKGEPCCLMGATSGFVYFFNACAERGLKFSLPAGSRVCDGGGYQGTFGDCTRAQYLALVREYLGVPDYMCVNTLGMGE